MAHHRSARWPSTANPHLLVNQMSANGTGPASTSYFAETGLRGMAATLERLRVDRQLQEALARGPDPLHLASEQDPGPARPRTVDAQREGEARMPGPGGDTLASVAETLAGLSAAARAGSLDDAAALAALSAVRQAMAQLERGELALIEAARESGAHGPASQPRRVPATGRFSRKFYSYADRDFLGIGTTFR